MFRRKRAQVNQFLLLCRHYLQNHKVNWELYEFIKLHCLSSAHLSSLKCLGVVTRMRSSFTIGRNTSNTNRRTYSDFQTPTRVENTKRIRVFFNELRGVLKSEKVLLTSV